MVTLTSDNDTPFTQLVQSLKINSLQRVESHCGNFKKEIVDSTTHVNYILEFDG